MNKDLSKVIDWNELAEQYTQAYISDFGNYMTIGIRKAGLIPHPVPAGAQIVKRPRKFEAGSYYPVVFDGINIIALFTDDEGGIFKYINDTYFERELSFIGEKLPDSLWDKE